MRISKYTFIILSIILTSCYSTKSLVKESKNQAVKFSIDKLNGLYKNKINVLEKNELWNILADNYRLKGDDRYTLDNSLVKLEVINKRKLKASLMENDSIIESLLFKGKITGKYFSINKKLFLTPIPALYLHSERKTILGNNKDGDLIITRGFKNAAWIIILTSNFDMIDNIKFEKKN